MFSPLYASPRGKQHLSFVASLTLQCLAITILCHLPISQCSRHSLATPDLHSALSMPVELLHPKPFANVDTPGLPAAAKELRDNAVEPKEPLLNAKLKLPGSKSEHSGKAAKAENVAAKAEPKPVEAKAAEAQPSEAEVKPADAPPTAEDATTQADAEANRGGEGGEGITPFSSWQARSEDDGQSFMHHQVKHATPIFTPDPPILHAEVPEPARGKDVVMTLYINEEGSIAAVKVEQGIGYGVENAIVETLKRWLYVPAKFNGKAIASQQQVRFHFPG